VLRDLPRDAQNFCRSPRKHVLVASEEVDELTFLFGAKAGPDLDGLGQVLGINLDSLGILSILEGTRCGGHGQVSQRGWCTGAQLLQLCGDDHQHNFVLLTVQRLLGLGLHDDDACWPRYHELEVGVAGDEHELDVTWPL
jgi:hypothetical protein